MGTITTISILTIWLQDKLGAVHKVRHARGGGAREGVTEGEG